MAGCFVSSPPPSLRWWWFDARFVTMASTLPLLLVLLRQTSVSPWACCRGLFRGMAQTTSLFARWCAVSAGRLSRYWNPRRYVVWALSSTWSRCNRKNILCDPSSTWMVSSVVSPFYAFRSSSCAISMRLLLKIGCRRTACAFFSLARISFSTLHTARTSDSKLITRCTRHPDISVAIWLARAGGFVSPTITTKIGALWCRCVSLLLIYIFDVTALNSTAQQKWLCEMIDYAMIVI